MVMRYLSVCSGIEAFSVAVKGMDWQAAAFAEIEAFPSKLLAHHYPDVPNLGDMTRIDTAQLGTVDWLVGGTPCQSFSIAGLRKGLDDDRGNLTLEFVKLAWRLADGNGLRGALWENVFGVLSDKTNAFGCFVAGLVGHDAPLVAPFGGRWPNAGMVAGPRARLAWRVLDSQHVGVPQRRRRVYVVVDFGNGPDPAAVLFEPRSQGGYFAPREEAREDVAGTLASRAGAGGGLGSDMDMAGGLQVAGTLDQSVRSQQGQNDDGRFLITSEYFGNAEGGNADFPNLTRSNVGKGVHNQSPLVAHVAQVADALVSNGDSHSGYRDERGLVSYDDAPAVALAIRGRSDGAEVELGNDQANALRGASGGASKPMAMVPAIAIQAGASRSNPSSGPDGIGVREDIAYTIEARAEVQSVATRTQIRRLTPIECERLQFFPDNYTLIPGLSGWRDVGDDESVAELEAAGLTIRRTKKSNKLRVNDPDGPRYKALGNSFTVSVIRALMRRADASMHGSAIPPLTP